MKFGEPVLGGPCWVELSTSDLAASRAFYGVLFGWRCETDPREEAGGYTVAHVGDAPVAALTPLYSPEQPAGWQVSFATADADASAEEARRLGGTLLAGPMDVFDMGRFAMLADPGGAVFHVWQARSFPGAGLLNAPGALGWVELATRAPEAALAFYPALLGWTVAPSEFYPQWGVDGADFGGMAAMDEEVPADVPPHWLPYFAVPDVDAAAERAGAAGGEVVMEPATVPEGPRICVLRDPQGAEFGIHRAYEEG
ncbi:VOC family protein [Streptomyces sp. NPDC050504]|uniref:VOC family protein n=1 Tax=Streptomyces sp. NPDC050504 TaxID=3365618 RepID=UPI0037A27ED0